MADDFFLLARALAEQDAALWRQARAFVRQPGPEAAQAVLLAARDRLSKNACTALTVR